MYRLKLKTAGKEYKSTGKTIEECLSNIGLSWNDIKNKGVLNVMSGVGKHIKMHEHLFNVIQLRRIFGNQLTKKIWAKRLETLLK